jgi:Ca2+:H+ antiporter
MLLDREQAEEEEEVEEEEDTATPDEEDGDLSDAESFTLKDRQEAINETHPFGIRIWKPALYKKNRSVTRTAEGDIHSAPGGNVSRWLWLFNGLWTIIFGWWLSLVAAIAGVACLILSIFQSSEDGGCREYGRVLLNLSNYLLYPFGKYVRLEREEAYLDEDEGLGRDLSEYERWQAGDLEEGRLFFGPTDINRSLVGRRRDDVPDLEDNETTSLLGRQQRSGSVTPQTKARMKKRLFGRGKWGLGRVVFFLLFYVFIAPCLYLVSGICWFLVFSIPMGKVTLLLVYHLQRHPLALSFHTDSHYAREGAQPRGSSDSVILLCTYRAVGLKYWKYTIDGTNIFLINLLGLVVFTIFDYFVLSSALHVDAWVTSDGFVFVLALASIIPLAYFIGQAVASISAQSSMGVGATINAFFSTVVEVFLYCVALHQGKAQLVEGSIIGSIFAGILFLPGLSMCFGALKRKTQRFNVKSASVTSTLLLFATIALFGPTLFYQIYGSHVLNCRQCTTLHPHPTETERDCRRCYFTQTPEINDKFFKEALQPYIWFAALCLFLSYVVGLLFTLRTHAAVIWNNEPDEKKETRDLSASQHHNLAMSAVTTIDATHPVRHEAIGSIRPQDIRDSQMYKRVLNQSLKQAGIITAPIKSESGIDGSTRPDGQPQPPHLVPPKSSSGDDALASTSARVQGLSLQDNQALVQQISEIAATAATAAARDVTRMSRRASLLSNKAHNHPRSSSKDTKATHDHHSAEHPVLASSGPAAHAVPEEAPAGGHDAPNWSRAKSAIILLTATVAYAVIAEILVDTVDSVLGSIDIDEKFLGITLFALVPNTTEFLNAISFAMNGNVALSMEIGSSYALQVILLQTPCLVLFSAFYGPGFWAPRDLINHVFLMIFPQWDMITVILAVFLMGWIVNEGKSNYFKGSILIFTYLVVVVGFWFSGYGDAEVSFFFFLFFLLFRRQSSFPVSLSRCRRVGMRFRIVFSLTLFVRLLTDDGHRPLRYPRTRPGDSEVPHHRPIYARPRMARPTLRRVHNEGRDAWELFAPGTMATWSALSDD